MNRIFPVKGIFAPLVTPFDAEENVDKKAFVHNIKKWATTGLRGLLPLGSNSEAVYLTKKEKLELVRLCAEHKRDDQLLLAGTGLESTRATLKLTKKAAVEGAQAALIITPHFYTDKMDDRALEAHYLRIAEESPIPVLIYHVEKYTHLPLSTKVVEKLADHPNIVGMKESSGSLAALMNYREATRGKDFQVLLGTAGSWLPALSIGMEAGIFALANCAPNTCVKLQTFYEQGRVEEARELYRKIYLLNQAVTARWGVAGLKEACTILGYQGGRVRSPLQNISEEEVQVIQQLIEGLKEDEVECETKEARDA